MAQQRWRPSPMASLVKGRSDARLGVGVKAVAAATATATATATANHNSTAAVSHPQYPAMLSHALRRHPHPRWSRLPVRELQPQPSRAGRPQRAARVAPALVLHLVGVNVGESGVAPGPRHGLAAGRSEADLACPTHQHCMTPTPPRKTYNAPWPLPRAASTTARQRSVAGPMPSRRWCRPGMRWHA